MKVTRKWEDMLWCDHRVSDQEIIGYGPVLHINQEIRNNFYNNVQYREYTSLRLRESPRGLSENSRGRINDDQPMFEDPRKQEHRCHALV